MPISGEVKRGITTFSMTPAHRIWPVLPVNTMVAPIRLPISACEDELGIENHQVKRSQMIAPINAAKIT